MKLSGQYIYQHSREFIKVGQNPDSNQAIRLGFRSRDKLFGDCWRLGRDPYDIESESNIEFESEGFQLFNYSGLQKICTKYFIQKKIHLHWELIGQIMKLEKILLSACSTTKKIIKIIRPNYFLKTHFASKFHSPNCLSI